MFSEARSTCKVKERRTEKRQNLKTSKGTIYKCQNQTEMTVKMANKLTY